MSNPSRNPFKLARQGGGAPQIVEAYESRSIWRSFKQVDGVVRGRYFNAEELAWLSRYGPRLDRLASLSRRPSQRAREALRRRLPRDADNRLRGSWLRLQVPESP